MRAFLNALEVQRWDDHRYYHHSTINQALHLVSAISFLCAYVLVFTDPVAAALLGWLVAMVARQVGHFFFEPKDYDAVNRATHEHKEEIKVGYNLHRKVVLMGLWAASPFVLYASPTLFGTLATPVGVEGLLHNLARVWIVLGVAALGFRAAQLCVLKNPQTAFVWLVKIVTDPFHDIMLYYKSPLYLLRGQLLDPTTRRHAR